MSDWFRGDWMQTHSGRRFYPLTPLPEDIDGDDIAHALSHLCRYGGHVDRFYSVAEHCVLMSLAVGPESALAALLHDAPEAYVVDVPRPVKQYLADYRDLEARVWHAIAGRFGVAEELPAEVRDADDRILVNERGALLSRAERWPSLDALMPLPVEVEGWAPQEAKRRYLRRLEGLTRAE